MKRLATFIRKVEFDHSEQFGKFTVLHNNAHNTIAYYFDGDRCLASDPYLSELITNTIVHDCKWVISIFNQHDIAGVAKRYNAALEELKCNPLTSQLLKDELDKYHSFTNWPTNNQFTTWIAAIVSPIYFHIINTQHHIADNFARQIVIDLLQSYYTDHPKIQSDKFNEEALEAALKRAV